jgi:hypothetical protein
MTLRQSGTKKQAKQPTSKNASEHDQADCQGTHDSPLPNSVLPRADTGLCIGVVKVSPHDLE